MPRNERQGPRKPATKLTHLQKKIRKQRSQTKLENNKKK